MAGPIGQYYDARCNGSVVVYSNDNDEQQVRLRGGLRKSFGERRRNSCAYDERAPPRLASFGARGFAARPHSAVLMGQTKLKMGNRCLKNT